MSLPDLARIFGVISEGHDLPNADGQVWSHLEDGGNFADTYTSQNFVLQLRSTMHLQRDIAQQPILKNLQHLPGVYCRFNHILIVCDGGERLRYLGDLEMTDVDPHECQGYWMLQERVPGIVINAAQANPAIDPIEAYRHTARSTFADLNVIAQVLTTGKLTNLQISQIKDAERTPGINAQMMPTNHVLELLALKMGADHAKLWSRVPFEAASAMVLSHGDPILKNNVINVDGNTWNSTLIDWETVQ